jgi:hypothetical protein
MSKKTRYLLLLLGFIFFILFTPVMVLYVTGLKYDLKTGQFTSTGILAIRSTPAVVDVILNGKKVRSSDGDIKFLLPGEYNLTLEKPGYQPWSKRFFVQENQVTWANPVPDNLFLFKQNTPPVAIASSTIDFALSGNTLLYLTPAGLTVTTTNNFSRSQTFPLKIPADNILASPDGQTFALGNSQIFNAAGQKISDIGNIVTASSSLEFSDDNNLFALENNTIYQLNVGADKKTALAKNASAFSVMLGNIYYLQQTATGSALYIQPLSGGQPQLLLNNLPTFSTGQIFVNFQKQVMLLLDGSLYQASSIPVLVANNITGSSFDQNSSNLMVLRGGELDFYNYSTQSLDFITRTSLPLSNLILRPDLDYAFFFKDGSLEALELDLRDQQNEYSFYQAQQPEKFILDAGGKNLYILDGEKLLEQTIR